MSHNLRLSDFRARRTVLDPDDFALSDGMPEPPPSDLIERKVWNSIVTLSDDVSIRTSAHHGTILKIQNELWIAWLHGLETEVSWEQPIDPAVNAILDVTDELSATTFEMLTGYYRQAASSLRSVIEIMLTGVYAKIVGKVPQEFAYRLFRRTVSAAPSTVALDKHLRKYCDRCVFADARFNPWVTDLYGRLAAYAHVRPGHSLADIRQSNGPVYVPRAVAAIDALFVETFMLAAVLARLARPDFVISANGRDHLLASTARPTKVAAHALVELFPESFKSVSVFGEALLS